MHNARCGVWRRALVFVLFASLACRAIPVHASNVTYPDVTTIYSTTNNVSVTVDANSSANQVVVDASTISVTMDGGDVFRLTQSGSYKLPNNGNLPECSTDSNGNHLTIGPYGAQTTVVITPSNQQCPSGGNIPPPPPPPPPPPDTQKPVVNVTSPLAGATVIGAVTVSAMATDNVDVVGVAFYVDGVQIGTEIMQQPYAFFWNSASVPNGAHVLKAVARDAANNFGESSINFSSNNPLDDKPPVISITAPIANAFVAGVQTFSANATDNIGVASVSFFVDNVQIGSDVNNAPYLVLWDTSVFPIGPHTLKAEARDGAGNVGTATEQVTVTKVADNIAPTITITSPTQGAVVSKTVSITANATDNVGVIGVKFFVDGKMIGSEDLAQPYGVSWSSFGVSNGQHTISAEVRDGAGNKGTASIAVTVSNEQLPPPPPPPPPVLPPPPGGGGGGVPIPPGGVPVTPPVIPVVPPVVPPGKVEAPVIVTPMSKSLIHTAKPTVTGFAAAGSVVRVLVDGNESGTAQTDAQGRWSFPQNSQLKDGAHVVLALSNTLSSSEVPFTVDTAPPAIPVIVEAKLVSAKKMPSGLYNGSLFVKLTVNEDTSVSFAFDKGTWFGAKSIKKGEWQTTLAGTFAEGTHTLWVRATDLVGNASEPVAVRFTVPIAEETVLTPEAIAPTSTTSTVVATDTPKIAALAPFISAIQNPVVQEVNKKVAAPTALVITAVNAGMALPGLGLLQYLQFLFLQPMMLFRKRRKWGAVFNSMTKMPVDLAIVRLYEASTKKLVRSAVTDAEGRFVFFVQPGTYYLQVTKTDFTFPSVYLADKKEDATYANLYHGEVVTCEQATVLAPNIAIDPSMADKPDAEILKEARKHKIHAVLGSVGVVFSALILLVSPTWINAAAFLAQIGVFFLFRRLQKRGGLDAWGMVSDTLYRMPLAASVVRIFEPQYNHLLDTQVTDKSGRYGFLVGRNKYYVTASKAGYKQNSTKVLDLTRSAEPTVSVSEHLALEPDSQTPALQPVVQQEAQQTDQTTVEEVSETPVEPPQHA